MTEALNSEPNLESPDDFYAALVAAHEGLSEARSAELNAALVLLLANQIGSMALLQQAIDAARAAVVDAGSPA